MLRFCPVLTAIARPAASPDTSTSPWTATGSTTNVLTDLVEVFNAEHHGITFTFDEYYNTEDDTSFGGDVHYTHAWNDARRAERELSPRGRLEGAGNGGLQRGERATQRRRTS